MVVAVIDLCENVGGMCGAEAKEMMVYWVK